MTNSNFQKLIGILLIIIPAAIILYLKCPSNPQYIICIILIGLGTALYLPKSAEQSKADIGVKNYQIKLAGAVVVPIAFVLLIKFTGLKSDSCSPFSRNISTTVFVHDKEGKQHLVLRKQGSVMMDIGSERRLASINENGQAFFQNLHDGDSIRLEIDFTEPYKSLHPDSIYIIRQDKNIDLVVALQGIDQVRGMVLYNESPLAGVIVKLQGGEGILLDTTDQIGDFTFRIPEKMQRSEYKVWFIKQGFKTQSVTSYPQTGQPLEVVLEKK